MNSLNDAFINTTFRFTVENLKTLKTNARLSMKRFTTLRMMKM